MFVYFRNIAFFFSLSLSGQTAQVLNLMNYNYDVYTLSDSLKSIQRMLDNGLIDSTSYLEYNASVLWELNQVAFRNYDRFTRLDEVATPEEEVQTTNESQDSSMDFNMDSIPEDPQTAEMPDFVPPNNPISLITGSGRRTSFKLRYGMFWNGLIQGKTQAGINYPEFNTGKSYNWFGEFDILMQTKLGKNKGPFSIYYGIGFDNRHYSQSDHVQSLSLKNDKPSFTEFDSLDKSTLHLNYFRIPVGLQYKKSKLVFNLGAYIGFLTKHLQSLEYETAAEEEADLFLNKDYDFESINYGINTSIGYKRIHLAFNYDLNSLFKYNNDYDYNPWKIGIMIF